LTVANKKERMTEDTRKSIIYQLITREISLHEVMNLQLVRDCRGQYCSFNTLLSRHIPLSIAPNKSRIAETIAMRKTATILHPDELRLWDVETLEQWREQLLNDDGLSYYRHSQYNKLKALELIDFNQLQQGFDDTLEIIKPSQLPPRIAAGKNALSYASKVMAKRIDKHIDEPINARKVLIGKSTVADGWTDGLTYIAINKEMVSLLDGGYYGALQLALLMLHEYCHDTQDIGSHEHDFAFFEKYHDLSSMYKNEIVGHTASSLYRRYLDELIKKNETLPKETINTFRYPVVNQTKELTGVMNGKLSPLAKTVLDMASIRYKVSKNKFIAVYNHWEDLTSINKYIDKLIKDSGIMLPDEALIRDLSDDYRKANLIINKEWDKVYAQYSQENDIPIELIKRLGSCHYPNDLFMALCHDKSGLVSFEYNSLINVKSLGSADVLYDFNPYSWELRGKTTQEIISSPQLRTEYALQAIKHIVDGIKNPIDRKAFIDNFFTENMKNQFNGK
ncbi:hypothetical protein, partial [Photobacterium damselae]|uniref:hypothetical protein n=1 Tax=Photobacterium damselae TaxID=38293 RepID=UPI0035A9988D